MQKSDDIVNLFQQFGGKADSYQEFPRSQFSKTDWPLLSAVDATAEEQIPSVQSSEKLSPTPAAPPVPWEVAPSPAAPEIPAVSALPAEAAPPPSRTEAAAASVTPRPRDEAAAAMPSPQPAPAALDKSSPLSRLASDLKPSTAQAGQPPQPANTPTDLKSIFSHLAQQHAKADPPTWLSFFVRKGQT